MVNLKTEHHLTLETGNYFLLGISPSIHFFLEYPRENIQIHSVLVLNLLLELSDQLHSICYPHRICRLQTAVLQSHLSHQLCLIWTRSLSDFFVVFLQRLCHVLPTSQHVHGTHAEIVVMTQLDTSINT